MENINPWCWVKKYEMFNTKIIQMGLFLIVRLFVKSAQEKRENRVYRKQ